MPFTLSKHHAVACMGTVIFDPKKKSIVQISEKRLKVGTQYDVVTMTEKTVMKDTNQDPVFLASINVTAA